MDEDKFAFNALYLYLRAGGRAEVSEGPNDPRKDRPFDITWRILDSELYKVTWWKAMIASQRQAK